MPATASSLAVRDAFDPYANIDAGVRHLRRLIDRFEGDLPLAVAAYNAGENAVVAYRGIPPYRETRRYVTRVLRRYGQGAERPIVPAARRPNA
jgi:soluble lytic murein transglycosylase-like protein